jgi:hypothetical protein
MPAVCPLKGNNSWVLRPRIAEHLIPESLRLPPRLLSASRLLLDEGRAQHARYRRVGVTPLGREDPLPGIEPHYVLGLGLKYRAVERCPQWVKWLLVSHPQLRQSLPEILDLRGLRR